MEAATKQYAKSKIGYYFGCKVVADFMIEMTDIYTHSKILEFSCGEAIFLDLLEQNRFNNLTAYEIDQTLAQQFSCVKFVSAKIEDKFDLMNYR
jgi:adenine-specific DNA-methyltransferase